LTTRAKYNKVVGIVIQEECKKMCNFLKKLGQRGKDRSPGIILRRD
jgi:hypothetical protein